VPVEILNQEMNDGSDNEYDQCVAPSVEDAFDSNPTHESIHYTDQEGRGEIGRKTFR